MRSWVLALAVASGAPSAALAGGAWPVVLVGEVCVTASGTCAPMSISANADGTLSITATVGVLTYSSSGTWVKRGDRIRVQDGSGSTYLGRSVRPCFRGTGTALGTAVTFETCR